MGAVGVLMLVNENILVFFLQAEQKIAVFFKSGDNFQNHVAVIIAMLFSQRFAVSGVNRRQFPVALYVFPKLLIFAFIFPAKAPFSWRKPLSAQTLLFFTMISANFSGVTPSRFNFWIAAKAGRT